MQKSGSGLANPWISNVLAKNHKHLIVSLTFSAKELIKNYKMQWNPLSTSQNYKQKTHWALIIES